MLSASEITYHAACGDLSFICCLTPSQLVTLRDWLSGMSNESVHRLHRIACVCSVPGQDRNGEGAGGTPPGPLAPDGAGGAVPACVASFQKLACGDSLITKVVVADEALGIVLALGGAVIPVQIRLPLFAVWTAMGGWIQACVTQTIPETVLGVICEGWDAVRTLIEDDRQIPSGTKEALKPVYSLFEDVNVVKWMDECCGADMGDTRAILQNPIAWSESIKQYLPESHFASDSPYAIETAQASGTQTEIS